jgi:integrase
VPDPEQVRLFLMALHGTAAYTVAQLQYGSGLSLAEALHLRVCDVDPARRLVTIRNRIRSSTASLRQSRRSTAKDRVLPLANAACTSLQILLFQRRLLHQEDLRQLRCSHPHHLHAHLHHRPRLRPGLPDGAGDDDDPSSWGAQFVFVGRRHGPASAGATELRPHLDDRHVLDLYRRAFRAVGLATPIGAHGLRHAFAAHLLDGGADVRTVQQRLGHARLSSTLVYLQHSRRGVARQVRSPLDLLAADAERRGTATRDESGPEAAAPLDDDGSAEHGAMS